MFHRHLFYLSLLYFSHISSCSAKFLPGLSNWYLFADVQAEEQEISNQRENNNSVYAAEKSPDKRTTNGGIEVNNASVVNSPDLSPVKNIRNGEAEEAEVRKTKVSFSFNSQLNELLPYCFNDKFSVGTATKSYYFSVQRWPTDKAYYIAKELLMTERTYKKDLDVINVVSETALCLRPRTRQLKQIQFRRR